MMSNLTRIYLRDSKGAGFNSEDSFLEFNHLKGLSSRKTY